VLICHSPRTRAQLFAFSVARLSDYIVYINCELIFNKCATQIISCKITGAQHLTNCAGYYKLD